MATTPSLATASDDAPEFPLDAVEVGRIAGAWGVKGAFKVQAYAGDPQALFSTKRWFLRPPDGPLRASMPAVLHITQAHEQAGMVVAAAREVADRTAAEALAAMRVFVSRASFPTAGQDEYYWVDLIGLSVVNREGVELGQVSDLLDTGAHSVLRVRRPDASPAATPDKAERLIPFVASYIDGVDLDARQIRVDWGQDF